jgi:hypothetical protein
MVPPCPRYQPIARRLQNAFRRIWNALVARGASMVAAALLSSGINRRELLLPPLRLQSSVFCPKVPKLNVPAKPSISGFFTAAVGT